MTTISQPIDINPTHLETIQHILDEHVPNCEVRAFGSRVKWTARDYSDLDLVIADGQPLGWRTLSRLETALKESDLPFKVDVLDWHDISDNFREIIKADCITVRESKKIANSAKPKWPMKKFGDCATLIRAAVDPSSVGDIPYIGLEHIGEGTLSLLNHGVASDVTSTKTLFKQGDILFGKLRPYFRKVIRAPFDGICSTDIWTVRAKEGIDQGYLYYCMASQPFIDFATSGSIGTRMPRAKWEYVSQYNLPVPTMSEQREIAHILESLDDKIELNRRMNETLEAMAQALFKSWFVDFNPVRAKMKGRWRPGESLPGLPAHLYDLFPDRLVPSELGEIPEGWDVKTLGDLCDKPQYGYTASAESEQLGPKFLRITDINKMSWIDWESVPYCKISKEHFTRYFLSKGDILIARIADPGHGCMIEEELIAVFASYLIRFRPINERYARYIQYWLRSDTYWEIVRQQATGTTRVSLNAKVLSNFPLIAPPTSIASIFNTQIDNIRSRAVANVKYSHAFAAKRDILFPILISRGHQMHRVARQKEAIT